MDREFRVISALYKQGFPVPRPLLYCNDPSVIGTEFYLMSYVKVGRRGQRSLSHSSHPVSLQLSSLPDPQGRNFSDPTLSGLPASERKSLLLAIFQTLARLHSIDWKAVGLEDYGGKGNYCSRQVGPDLVMCVDEGGHGNLFHMV